MKILAYLKPECGWSQGVRAIFKKYNLEYQDIDIFNPLNYQEMVEKSKQSLSPCVEINGTMLADVSGEEVEEFLVEKNLVEKKEENPEVSIDSACQGH